MVEVKYGSVEEGAVVDESNKDAKEAVDDHIRTSHSVVEIKLSEETPNKPTIGPVGRKMKRNSQIQYNPYDWRSTLFSFHDGSYSCASLYFVGIVGTVLVLVSRIAGMGLRVDNRVCRAWCSRFSLGSQPHSYMGFILFLLMAFRTREAYRMYQAGLNAHYKAKVLLSRIADTILFKNSRDAIDERQRARMIAFCIALPYSFTADMREERRYDTDSIQGILSPQDMDDLLASSSMPVFLIEGLVVMVRVYCEKKFSTFSLRRIYSNLEELYSAYNEMEKIKTSPCAFAYVAHLRFLLMAYLISLPLALVEQMGYSTIPVFWVICYSLMSLEMMAVEVENPWGYGSSDLRMHEYNLIVKESLLESWNRWKSNLDDVITNSDRLNSYNNFNTESDHAAHSFDHYLDGFFSYW